MDTDHTSRTPVSQTGYEVSPEADAFRGDEVAVEINGISLRVPFGESILDACRSLSIKVPTICQHDDLKIAGLCRMCLVEVEGMHLLQAACSFPITSPIKIFTSSPRVRRARRDVLDLLLSEHLGECYACIRNNNCELQALAKEYGVDSYRFGHVTEEKHPLDFSSPSLVRDMNKCILCKRCVRTCIDLQEVGVLEAIGRGDETYIGTFLDKPLRDVVCIYCGQCINRCPTGALRANDPSDKIWEAIDKGMHLVIQTAPSPRASICEEFSLPAGQSLTGELNTALHRMGFSKVFDTNFAADLTIIEEGHELLGRIRKKFLFGEEAFLPQFTSCSPGWVKFIEHFYPDCLDYLSTAKSPQQMFGALIKTYYAEISGISAENIVSVALMPCSAKKFECSREEMASSGYRDVDYGLTTRELASMIKEAGIELPAMPKSPFDEPFGQASGAGQIFGATGGVMEAALRTVYEIMTGRPVPFKDLIIEPLRGFEGIKRARLRVTDLREEWKFLEGTVLGFMAVHGTANAKIVMEMLKNNELKDFQFIEVMACPGGCLGGGGQPIPTNLEIRRKRAHAIYTEEESLPVRKSHENLNILSLYKNFLKDGPNGLIAHRLLHTRYTKRGKFI